jgi:hypothetical protein
MRYRRRQLVLTSVFVLFVALFFSGCSDDSPADEGGCTSDEQCATDEICLQGACLGQGQAYCSTDEHCPSGPYECVDQVCKRTDFDTGQGSDSTNNDGNDTDVPDDTDDDVSVEGAPQVESVSPAPDATDVALDTPIEVTFNEPMDPFTITFYSIQLRDTNNRDVPVTVDYDDASHTATITPQNGLRPASGYRIKVESLARDTDGIGVDPEFESSFYTGADEPQAHTALAETFAPVLYQGIADTDGSGPNGDIPTRLDFDGNLSAADNGANSRRAQTTTKAHVYYSVTESEQYFFIHYVLYYPSRLDTTDQSRAEHDFAGAVLVVDKETEALLLAEGVQLLASGEATLAYKPSGSPVSLPGGGIGNMNLDTFDASTLEDGTHYPMYVPGGVHQTCNWHKSGQNGRCLHSPGEFGGDDNDGVVMRLGDSAQSYDEATMNQDSGHLEMSYELVPMAESIWAVRGSYSSGGLFDVPFVYNPIGTERPLGYTQQQAHVLPTRLQSSSTTTFGRMPFAWMANAGENNDGQWLMDPVYILPNRYNFGETVSTEYCHNFFFDIDHRTDGALPGCGDN